MQDDGQAGRWWNLLRSAPTPGNFVVFGARICGSMEHCAQFLKFSESAATSDALAGAISAVRAISHKPSRRGSVTQGGGRASPEQRWLTVLTRSPTPRNCVLFGAYVEQSVERCERFLLSYRAVAPSTMPLADIAAAVNAISKRLELADAVNQAAVEARASLWRTPAILLSAAIVVFAAGIALMGLAGKTSWHTVATLNGEPRHLTQPSGGPDLNKDSAAVAPSGPSAEILNVQRGPVRSSWAVSAVIATASVIQLGLTLALAWAFRGYLVARGRMPFLGTLPAGDAFDSEYLRARGRQAIHEGDLDFTTSNLMYLLGGTILVECAVIGIQRDVTLDLAHFPLAAWGALVLISAAGVRELTRRVARIKESALLQLADIEDDDRRDESIEQLAMIHAGGRRPRPFPAADAN
jgi:hypothetical protein